jgi:hypothetical protein
VWPRFKKDHHTTRAMRPDIQKGGQRQKRR